MTVATLTCAMVTLCVLFYVFYLPGRLHMGPEKTRLAYLQERKEMVYENLRDLNFEHQAGKLPDQDFQSLKASLEDEAAGILAEMARLEQAATRSTPRPKGNPSLKLSPKVVAAALAILLSSVASAQTLSGTLKNGTTGKPAAGDDVILIKLGQGMEEAARTKADASGHFSFKVADAGPHLIRAVHQGVTYHSMAPPGTNSVEVQVFDVSKKLNDISVTADVMRFQAQGNELQGTRLFAVNNTSNPPRTQMNDQNFEFYLPEGARIAESSAETAGGQPLKTDPVPQKEKNRYAFNFPVASRPDPVSGWLRTALQWRVEHRSQIPLPGAALCRDAAQDHAVFGGAGRRLRVPGKSKGAGRHGAGGVEHRTGPAVGIQDFGYGDFERRRRQRWRKRTFGR